MMGLKLSVVLVIAVAMALLQWRKVGMLTWALAWTVALYCFFRFGFVVPVPGSVITLYMAIAVGSILAYISSSEERWKSFTEPILRLILEPRLKMLLYAVVLLIPAMVAAGVYSRLSVPLEAPGFGRSVHPAPPDQITVHETEYDLRTADNPYAKLEPGTEEYEQHYENGRRVYFENCFYCHGDGMGGDGMFAHGLNPIPTNFTDPGVLPILQSSFIFWRVSKGGPGLPEEGGPWETAMPAWEKFLTEEEMWDVVLFLFEFTGFDPRALHDEVLH